MHPRSFALLWLACGFLLLAAPSTTRAAVPPDRDDPCARAARNACGTVGDGFYSTSRYGTRWLGDYHGAIPGVRNSFCIDLRFWYAARAYRYREVPVAGLRNRDGDLIPPARLQKLAYAIWEFGRTAKASRQAAVSLYVHSLMGDGRPGELDPAAANPAVASLYKRVARAADRYHGPYRIETRFSGTPIVGEPATATIRVVSAAGHALPDVPLTLSARDASGLPEHVRTDGSGAARVALTATTPDDLVLVASARLASPLPRLFRATTGAAARSAQRLAVPDSRQTAQTFTAPTRSRLALAGVATPARVGVGEASRSRLTLSGARPGWRGTVAVSIYGPFRRPTSIRCIGTPSWQGAVAAGTSGVFMTPATTFDRPGWYLYRASVPGGAREIAAATRCDDRAQRVLVEAQPTVAATVSSDLVRSGAPVFDQVVIAGLAGEQALVHAALYGPFPTRRAITCEARPIWSGSLAALDNGDLATQPFTLTKPGLYVYSVHLDATAFVRSVETACGEVGQTTTALAQMRLSTPDVVRTGSDVSSVVRVQNLGTAARVAIEVFGPFVSRSATRCAGRPYWKGRISERGGRAVASPAAHLARSGFYLFSARVIGEAVRSKTATKCTHARTLLAAPRIVTGGRLARAFAGARTAGPRTPTRVRVPSVDLDAPVSPAGIDTVHGMLGVPAGIRRGGWWRDGATPGAHRGTVLLAGHVDSALGGEGAFFNLHRVRRGDRVEVTGAGGETFGYKVVSIRMYAKNALPTSIYSRKGAPRLVLVTCGGPFDSATGRYRDNIVVTAAPSGSS
jgi:hypothetical protein